MKTSQIQVVSIVACLFLSAAMVNAQNMVIARQERDYAKEFPELKAYTKISNRKKSSKASSDSLKTQIKQVQNEILRAAINISEAHNGPEETRPMPGSARWKELEAEHTSRLNNALQKVLKAEQKILADFREQEDQAAVAE